MLYNVENIIWGHYSDPIHLDKWKDHRVEFQTCSLECFHKYVDDKIFTGNFNWDFTRTSPYIEFERKDLNEDSDS